MFWQKSPGRNTTQILALLLKASVKLSTLHLVTRQRKQTEKKFMSGDIRASSLSRMQLLQPRTTEQTQTDRKLLSQVFLQHTSSQRPESLQKQSMLTLRKILQMYLHSLIRLQQSTTYRQLHLHQQKPLQHQQQHTRQGLYPL